MVVLGAVLVQRAMHSVSGHQRATLLPLAPLASVRMGLQVVQLKLGFVHPAMVHQRREHSAGQMLKFVIPQRRRKDLLGRVSAGSVLVQMDLPVEQAVPVGRMARGLLLVELVGPVDRREMHSSTLR